MEFRKDFSQIHTYMNCQKVVFKAMILMQRKEERKGDERGEEKRKREF